MAGLLPDEIKSEPKPFIGYQLLNIITSGMYDDPLMVYREYVQNAVDSIDVAVEKGILSKGQGRITIQVDGNDRRVSIEDNGSGIPGHLAARVLLNLGFSPKDGEGHRGFRGIGRLGGLAYCDLLRFTTRSVSQERVTIVEWDRKQLDRLTEKTTNKKSLIQVVKNITKVYDRAAGADEQTHFFRVEMLGVRRFHSDKLMGIKPIRDYLGQISPVPYDQSIFSHAERLDQYFSDTPGYWSYSITVNGKSVTRPYSDKIQVSTNIDDVIRDIKAFEFAESKKPLAKGWYAEIDYRGALPQSVPMRGIRVRQGNIQIGDEYFLAPYYLERRFATWVIGEIQICDFNIRPNARRDGFEHTPEYESFLEQVSVLCRLLSSQCRKSSKQRSSLQAATRHLDEIESRLDNLVFFIDEEHRERIASASLQKLEQVKRLVGSSNDGEAIRERYGRIALRISEMTDGKALFHELLDRENLNNIDSVTMIAKILKSLQEEYSQCRSIEDLMLRVVKPFLKE